MSNSIGVGFSQTATGSSGFTTGSLGSLLKFVSGIGYPYNGPGPKLGGGLPGLMPQPIIEHDNSSTFSSFGNTSSKSLHLLLVQTDP